MFSIWWQGLWELIALQAAKGGGGECLTSGTKFSCRSIPETSPFRFPFAPKEGWRKAISFSFSSQASAYDQTDSCSPDVFAVRAPENAHCFSLVPPPRREAPHGPQSHVAPRLWFSLDRLYPAHFLGHRRPIKT